MTAGAERVPASGVAGRTSLAIDNLRAVVILLVLAFHSVLAYLEFLPHRPFAFDEPALPVARLSDCRRPALARLRPVLRLARRLPDVVLSVAVGAVHLAEPGAQGSARVSVGPGIAARPAVCRGRHPADAAGALPDLSAERGRSRPRRLLAALAALAAMAERAGVVLVDPAGRRSAGGRADLFADGRQARDRAAALGLRAAASGAVFCRFGDCLGASPTCRWRCCSARRTGSQRGPFSFQLSRPLHYAVYFLAGVRSAPAASSAA